MRQVATLAGLLVAVCTGAIVFGAAEPVRAKKAMVISQSTLASDVGGGVLRDGGNAVDAAVATAFALAVTHPTAGNIGGGGFLVLRLGSGEAVTYDFRETAPARASPTMFLRSGGVAVVQALNILEGFDLGASGFGSARTIHTIAESMRRAFADRAQYLGDPGFNTEMPLERLTSKDYAASLRRTINPSRA